MNFNILVSIFMKCLGFFIFSLVFINSFASFSSEDEIQALKDELEITKGADRLDIIGEISGQYLFTSFVLSERYARIGLIESFAMKDTLKQIFFYRKLGGIKQYSSQLDSASYYFQKSIEIGVIYEDEYQQSLSRLNLASVYIYTGDFETAINIYYSSLEPLIDKKDTSALSITYNNMSTAYTSIEELDSAELYIKKALVLKNQLKRNVSYAISLTNLSDIYMLRNQYEESEKVLKEALNIFENEESTYNISYVCIALSGVYIATGEGELSELYLHRAIELSEKVGSIKLKAEAFLNLSELFEKNDNPERALEFYKKYNVLNDSIATSQYSSLLNEMKVAFELEEKDRELLIAKTEIQLQKGKIQSLWIMVGGFIGIVLLIIFFYIRISRKNRILFKQSIKTIPSHVIDEKLPKQNDSEEFDPKLEELFQQIHEKLEKEKIFLDASLTISKLSEMLDSNNNYISKCINHKYGENFNSVLNQYRVTEAKLLLQKDTQENYTLAAIGEMCGFTSISVFNRSFKKETGITPSYFIKSIKQES